MEPSKLADRIEALDEFGSNALDVLCEIALFEPDGVELSIRANAAGTKVIYTDALDGEITCWARDWTIEANRAETLAALRKLSPRQRDQPS